MQTFTSMRPMVAAPRASQQIARSSNGPTRAVRYPHIAIQTLNKLPTSSQYTPIKLTATHIFSIFFPAAF